MIITAYHFGTTGCSTFPSIVHELAIVAKLIGIEGTGVFFLSTHRITHGVGLTSTCNNLNKTFNIVYTASVLETSKYRINT